MDRPLAVGQTIFWRRKQTGDAPSTDPAVNRHHIKEMAGDNLLGLVSKMPYAQDLQWIDLTRIEIVRVEDGR